MARIRTNNVFGTVTDNPLTNIATTMNSAGLANLAAVASPDEAVITLDPNRVNGAPEIVVVTAHTASATSATIQRGQFGTAARQHPQGTEWVHGPVAGRRPANGQVGDWLSMSPPACRLTHSVAQAIANTTRTALAFNTKRFDTDSMHDAATNNSRITFNTAGIYVVNGNVSWPSGMAATTPRVELSIRKNGTITVGSDERFPPTTADGSQNAQQVTTVYKFAAGDYVELMAYQTSGASVNVSKADEYTPEFAAVWVGTGD